RGLESKFEIQEIFFLKALLSKNSENVLKKIGSRAVITEISREVFSALAMREDSDGLIAVFAQQDIALADLKLKDPALIMIAENLEKPGNLGALLRTADGAGVNALILVGQSVDRYNSNALRASLGASFSIPTIETSSEEAVAFCKKKNLQIVAAS